MPHAPGLRTLTDWLRYRDGRSSADIERDIEDEIAFHLEMRVHELCDAGMSETAAQQVAVEKFGDVMRVKDRCRTVQLGERIMLQRVNVILLAVLLAGMLAIGFQSWTAQSTARAEISRMSAEIHRLTRELEGSESARSTSGDSVVLGASSARAIVPSAPAAPSVAPFDADREAETWLARARTVTTWRAGVTFGEEISRLPQEQSLAILTRIWSRIPTVDCRKQLLKAFVFNAAQDDVCDVLHLAATDSEIGVQTWAFLYLRGIAGRDFTRDPMEYASWHRENAGRPLPEILSHSMSDMMVRVRGASDADLKSALHSTRDLDLRLIAAHIPAQASNAWRADIFHEIERGANSGDESLQEEALGLAIHLGVDDAFRRSVLDPLLAPESHATARVRASAVAALDSSDFEGKTDRLVALYEQGSANGARRDAMSDGALESLARSQDAHVIPAMIKFLARADGQIARRDVGQVLEAITGVPLDDAHDAAFWLEWFDKNRRRLPAELRDVRIVATRGG
jgi:hypothetical protein